eukprot:scaffold122810_cov18-Tisochrysis_lutea.AAC.1
MLYGTQKEEQPRRKEQHWRHSRDCNADLLIHMSVHLDKRKDQLPRQMVRGLAYVQQAVLSHNNTHAYTRNM